MNLTDLQRYKMEEAHLKARSVLEEIKRKTLKAKELEAMKTLERAVQAMEAFRMMVG